MVAIVAVNGCYLDAYFNDSEATGRLHERFPDATVEDAEPYL